ncbi:hypothetical protein Enr10x_58610 [Gimesia panareensis]|uniref:Methyltransferase domain protein n=1 Tax=Gimesia panareensis TaxID=2527978 RepID=A0A517QFZ1_9PLAN|nr:class I SAM-dependent methyltransferase [Gimesia panareensis]QDT30495.1 hypothetical protein Enr10x_58610 [Gimesia panareensis]
MSYWDGRKDLNYYQTVREWLGPFSGTLLDVGCADTPVAQWGNFGKRYAVNNRPFPDLSGVECIEADWMETELQADVITCLQVIEHFETDFLREFVAKIFRSCQVAIISVPYLWSAGSCPGHHQDPIDVRKFLDLTNREPVKLEIVTDSSCRRLIALFESE